jgi:hypothetical protein
MEPDRSVRRSQDERDGDRGSGTVQALAEKTILPGNRDLWAGHLNPNSRDLSKR